MDTFGTIKKINNKLLNANHALLATHKNPDSDSLGAACAMFEYLKNQNVKATIYCKTDMAPQFQFLPNAEHTVKTIPRDIDVVCAFDAGDEEYANIPEIISHLNNKPIIINIDHHISNELFGDINLVVPDMPSTTSVCYLLFQQSGARISRDMATNLLAGLISDTGTFSNPMANAKAMEIGSSLLECGARIPNIVNAIERTKPISALKLWGRALKRLTRHPKFNLAYTVITQKDHNECGTDDEHVSGLSNFLNCVSDCLITLILVEDKDGNVKGSLRTTFEHADVFQFAKALGGGGHKKASGFTIKGEIIETEKGWKIV